MPSDMTDSSTSETTAPTLSLVEELSLTNDLLEVRILELEALNAVLKTQLQSSSATATPNADSLAEEDIELEEYIMSTIYVHENTTRMSDITGQAPLKSALEWTLGFPAKNPELFSRAHTPPRGVLLYGPPGCGKTLLVTALAREYNVSVFDAGNGAVTSKWHGESFKLIRALFKKAAEHSPSVILFDEVDSLLHTRTDKDGATETKEVNALLSAMDGIQKTSSMVLTVGTTNRPWALDDAAMRRFPVKLYAQAPSFEDRCEYTMTYFTRHSRNIVVSHDEIKLISTATANFSYSALRDLCYYASLKPLVSLPREFLATISYAFSPAVEYAHFAGVLDYLSADITEDQSKQLDDFYAEKGDSRFMTQSTESCTPLHPQEAISNKIASVAPTSKSQSKEFLRDSKLADEYYANRSKPNLKLDKAVHRHEARQLFIIRAFNDIANENKH